MAANHESDNRFSTGVQCLGVPLVDDYLRRVSDAFSHVPFVSVGSGCGAIEETVASDVDWICIDPAPQSYASPLGSHPPPVVLAPMYPRVEDLISARGTEIVGSCLMFLNWAPPSDTYDMDAIHDLHPLAIVAIYDRAHAAGGELFHQWMHIGHPGYIQVVQTHTSPNTGRFFVEQDVIITLLARQDQASHTPPAQWRDLPGSLPFDIIEHGNTFGLPDQFTIANDPTGFREMCSVLDARFRAYGIIDFGRFTQFVEAVVPILRSPGERDPHEFMPVIGLFMQTLVCQGRATTNDLAQIVRYIGYYMPPPYTNLDTLAHLIQTLFGSA